MIGGDDIVAEVTQKLSHWLTRASYQSESKLIILISIRFTVFLTQV